MKPGFLDCGHTRTPFIQLDTRKCKACWKCLEECPSRVINKVGLLWHKHALIVEPDKCTGCLKCISICEYDVFSEIDKASQGSERRRKRTFNNFLINNLLLISGLLMILSGLVLQMGFHFGAPDVHQAGVHEVQAQSVHYEQIRGIDTSKIVCGLTYPGWSAIHKFAIVCLSSLMMYHIYAHWKWYKGVIAKRLIRKSIQVIILSVLFLLVAITGYIPWFVDLSGSTSILRMLFIEIHDKIALVLIIFLIVHIIQRSKWMVKVHQ
jgi:NAD-dependent dihydropyrimidine dehydrogenase PreA subunit